ncbi:MAG: asparagine synthase (glutamine-hydrolyzing) [Bacteroidetes bacterium]|nr:asparagine synthase (glutamine-hydrolyzing) [Bacteroidota bacterium]
MCGITGIYSFTETGRKFLADIENALEAVAHRGPDHKGVYNSPKLALGHARLSILDVSEASHQPFMAEHGESVVAFNGEIFNYATLQNGLNVRTSGDVEVLLRMFDREQTASLEKFNGFFAFAHYNNRTDTLFLVRDRLGIKPLYYYCDGHILVFASEIKPILKVVGKQKLDQQSLYNYFRFNYIPGPASIFASIRQVPAGHYMKVQNDKVVLESWYRPEQFVTKTEASAKSEHVLRDLLNDAVRLRLHADVPVGCFLSGGIDSSVVSALAAQQHNQLHTFSIGFKDEPYFDETHYAEKVARHIGSEHKTFKLSNDDLLDNLDDFLKSIDEPFADSSALNFYILSKLTARQVKVSLSGDGADELFMGYHKHRAEWMANESPLRHLHPVAGPVLKLLPKSRNSRITNVFRQMDRFYSSAAMSPKDRYLNWASISAPRELRELLVHPAKDGHLKVESFFDTFPVYEALNLADLSLVLADDMLVKVDRMSMQHGIEIRNPFLDYRVVEFALGSNLEHKITRHEQKVILRKAFGDMLPAEIFQRKKKGFEVPLLKWFNGELRSRIENDWLSVDYVKAQGIFNPAYIQNLKTQLYSLNPGDVAAKVWAVIVFQQWYKHMEDFIDA